MRHRFCAAIGMGLLALSAQAVAPDRNIEQIVREISPQHIADTMKKLTSFETRGNFTDPTQGDRGIGAARRWIYDQFHAYDPRLEVSFDVCRIKVQNKNIEVVNVVAVLPGTTQPEKRIIVGGHYDSYAPRRVGDTGNPLEAPAPGATDNASGTAVVLELARVMSKYEFEKSLVFIAFGGEEIGLIGSAVYADRALKQGEQIEAILNNDIVSGAVPGTGRTGNTAVRIFSGEPADSPSRELARYIRETAQRYLPSFKADLIFRSERISRGGDQLPFAANGFAAVRFTTTSENLSVQHTADDTFDRASPSYAANVARMNGAALANLALAPSAPVVNGCGVSIHPRDAGGLHYDAVLRWRDPDRARDLAGYIVVTRSTTAPFWEHEVWVGIAREYRFPHADIDGVVAGVKAIDKEEHESLVAPFVAPCYSRTSITFADE